MIFQEEGAYKNENDQDISVQRMELECLLRKKQANETSCKCILSLCFVFVLKQNVKHNILFHEILL